MERESCQKRSAEAKSACDGNGLNGGNLEHNDQRMGKLTGLITYSGFSVWLAVTAICHADSRLQERSEAFDRQSVVLWTAASI
jgi:hypothetical protein